jgi:hypothetical protein
MTTYGPTLAAIVAQRKRANEATREATKAGATVLELVTAARNIRQVVEQEWDLAILLQER